MERPRFLVTVAATGAAVFAALLLALAVHRGPLPFDGAVRDWSDSVSGSGNRLPAVPPGGSTPQAPTAAQIPARTPAQTSSRVRDLMRPIARLGAREVLIPLLLLGGGYLWLRRRSPGPLVMLVGSYLGMAMVVGPVKTLLHRPEPFDGPGQVGLSYPSGHAAQAILVYGMLAALVVARPMGARVRAAAVAVPVVACASVGIALVVRNAHWLSDMVGGYAIGLAWLAGPLALADRLPWLLGLPSDRETPISSK